MEVHLDQALNIDVAIGDNKGEDLPILKRDRDIVRDQDRDELPDKDLPQYRNELGKGKTEDEPSEQPVNSGEGGSGDGSGDVFDPYDPYDPYHNPEGPPYGPGQQNPAADQGNDDNYGAGPQPEEPPTFSWGPGPGGPCDIELYPCEAPYGPYGPLDETNWGPGPGEGGPSSDPPSGDGGDSSGDGGDGSEDSSGDGSEDSSGDSGSGSSGEDGKAP